MTEEQLNLNFLGADFLQICTTELLKRINKEDANDNIKKEIIEEFVVHFCENIAIMITNNTDTDEHLEEIIESVQNDSSFLTRRKLFVDYIPNFDNKVRDLIELYIEGFKNKYNS